MVTMMMMKIMIMIMIMIMVLMAGGQRTSSFLLLPTFLPLCYCRVLTERRQGVFRLRLARRMSQKGKPLNSSCCTGNSRCLLVALPPL